ncbi:hypothetical protein MLD38_029053 [Melastoma candidum]|uniref:Uncharacterized protein n=1 Tax=Melastoma candidum TaxID=119954 RepID=A0ACB9N534_9MYRT|nr:hypothetical protein MLD38_029053 [Melastoma candidum]
MAAASWRRTAALGISTFFGKPSPSLRRIATASVYDKNPDDHIRPAVVPDEVIQPESDKYWAPHPQTGVFGPASGHKTTTLETNPVNAGERSVLEDAAWFRPTSLEDLEKPLQS